MGRRPKNQQTEDEVVIDLDSYDWGDVKLTRKEKMFIILYTTPFQPFYQDSTQAAKKAGYKTKSAYNAKDFLLANPKIKKLIDDFTDNVTKVTVHEAATRFIQEKIKRASYNVKDYYEIGEYTNKNGDSIVMTKLKPINELSREEASIINNIQINQSGIATYDLPSKEKEMADVIKLDTVLSKGADANKFDVETTVDVVKENLATIKTTVMLRNQEIRENAGNYIETSDDLPEYD